MRELHLRLFVQNPQFTLFLVNQEYPPPMKIFRDFGSEVAELPLPPVRIVRDFGSKVAKFTQVPPPKLKLSGTLDLRSPSLPPPPMKIVRNFGSEVAKFSPPPQIKIVRDFGFKNMLSSLRIKLLAKFRRTSCRYSHVCSKINWNKYKFNFSCLFLAQLQSFYPSCFLHTFTEP